MNTFATIAGWVFLILLSGGFLAFGVMLTIDAYRKLNDRFYQRAYDQAVTDLSLNIASCAYWFSEDDATFKCLKILGQGRYARCLHPDEWRDKWRAAIKAAKGEQ